MVASLTFYEAIPGLIDILPASLQKDVERLKLAPYEASIAAMRHVLADWHFDRDWSVPQSRQPSRIIAVTSSCLPAPACARIRRRLAHACAGIRRRK